MGRLGRPGESLYSPTLDPLALIRGMFRPLALQERIHVECFGNTACHAFIGSGSNRLIVTIVTSIAPRCHLLAKIVKSASCLLSPAQGYHLEVMRAKVSASEPADAPPMAGGCLMGRDGDKDMTGSKQRRHEKHKRDGPSSRRLGHAVPLPLILPAPSCSSDPAPVSDLKPHRREREAACTRQRFGLRLNPKQRTRPRRLPRRALSYS